jgi:hypothetical protein
MTILDNSGESELVQLLNTIQELSEQLAQNRSLSIALHASAGVVKVCTSVSAGLVDTKSTSAESGCSLSNRLCAKEVRLHRVMTTHIHNNCLQVQPRQAPRYLCERRLVFLAYKQL